VIERAGAVEFAPARFDRRVRKEGAMFDTAIAAALPRTTA